MIYRYAVQDDSVYTLPGGVRVDLIKVDVLQTSQEDLKLMLMLISPTKRVYYSAKLNRENGFTVRPEFILPKEREFQLILVTHPTTRGFLGQLSIDLE